MDEQQRNLAIEELKILSSIIGRIENAIYQKQGWLFTLITGLTLALFKDDPLICKQQFAAISVIITIIFYIADIIQRIPVHRSIQRSKDIESNLRQNGNYDGPKISDSLGLGEDGKDLLKFFYRPRICAPYLAIIGLIIIIYNFAP